ncbi:MAG: YbaN family protein [Ruminiclostridium sp.]|nr:YbaN family protein [Ruminiclostridium sp.]
MLLGFICLALGTIGVVLPILPTVPFYLATVFFFANSSQKLHDWFTGTKLYKKYLESYVQKRGMTVRTKLSIIIPVTIMMAVGFLMMFRVPVGQMILACVWVAHLIYFIFIVKTISKDDAAYEQALNGKYPYRIAFKVLNINDEQAAERLRAAYYEKERCEALVTVGVKTVIVYLKELSDKTAVQQKAVDAGFELKA